MCSCYVVKLFGRFFYDVLTARLLIINNSCWCLSSGPITSGINSDVVEQQYYCYDNNNVDIQLEETNTNSSENQEEEDMVLVDGGDQQNVMIQKLDTQKCHQDTVTSSIGSYYYFHSRRRNGVGVGGAGGNSSSNNQQKYQQVHLEIRGNRLCISPINHSGAGASSEESGTNKEESATATVNNNNNNNGNNHGNEHTNVDNNNVPNPTTPSTSSTTFQNNVQQSSLEINLLNVVGVQRLKGSTEEGVCFNVYEYGVDNRRQQRFRKEHRIKVDKGDLDSSIAAADYWVTVIYALIHAHCPSKKGVKSPRRLYILVNPHSGPGKALQLFHDRVSPILNEANVNCKLVITDRPNHGKELVNKLNIDDWDGIVIVSGDGLVYEVVNGILERNDAMDVFQKLPIGMIPGGSGNSLCCTIQYENNEPIKDYIFGMLLSVACPRRYLPLPLIEIQTDTKGSIYSFLTLSWGLLADIDIESEKWRKTLGGNRFFLGAAIRIIGLRSYRGRISWLPAPDVSNVESTRFQKGGGRESRSLTRRNAPRTLSESNSEMADGERELSELERREIQRFRSVDGISSASASGFNNGRDRSESPMSTASSPKQHYANPMQVEFTVTPTTDKARVGPQGFPGPGEDGSIENPQLDPDNSRVSINDKIPSNWISHEDDFVFATVAFMSHLGPEIPYLPSMKLGDEVMYLTLVRKSKINRSAILGLLLGLESSDQLNRDYFEIYPCYGVRIETLGHGGQVAIDGEAIDGVETLHAHISPYTAKVMSFGTYQPPNTK